MNREHVLTQDNALTGGNARTRDNAQTGDHARTGDNAQTGKYVLTIENLQSYFFTAKGTVPAVDDVTIEVPAGKIIGLVGESGCGKSMTAMSVMGLLRHPGKVVGGRITLDGRDITYLNPRERARIRGNEISMIFQEPMTSLNPVYPVGRQVQEAILLHQKVSRAEAKQQVIEIFKEVGIPEPEKRYNSYPHQLSGGLRQRVMIGMAMVCKPKVIIADEPTTALDVTIEAQILRLMKRLRDEQGTSIILITHNMGVVAEVCDYVYVMYAGMVMEQAEVFDLFENTSHPYTQGLLKSIPKLDSREERLYTIEGVVPNLLRLPEGCNFCNRCGKAEARCLKEKPGLYGIGADGNGMSHKVRCFLYEGMGMEDAGAVESGRPDAQAASSDGEVAEDGR